MYAYYYALTHVTPTSATHVTPTSATHVTPTSATHVTPTSATHVRDETAWNAASAPGWPAGCPRPDRQGLGGWGLGYTSLCNKLCSLHFGMASRMSKTSNLDREGPSFKVQA